jgi:hypothetical protein
MRAPILLPVLLLFAGCAGSGGTYPSLLPRAAEIPRDIAAPGEGVSPSLADEQQQSLRADVARERAALEQAERAISEQAAALNRAIASARGSQPGSESWGSAQMALSRFDLARSPVGDIRARLAPLERTVDSLPAENPDRRSVLDLAARAAAIAARAAEQSDSAAQALRS